VIDIGWEFEILVGSENFNLMADIQSKQKGLNQSAQPFPNGPP
jgi:hypothetical protein